MELKNLSKWLKLILIGVGICGLIVFAAVIPLYGMDLRTAYPEFANRFWPWLILLWVSGIPCFTALVFAWRIATNIGKGQSFTAQNASLLKKIATLAVGDAGFFFVGNIVFLFLNLSHPGIVLASFGIAFVGIAVAVAAAVFSHLVKKAAALQEQSDWTI